MRGGRDHRGDSITTTLIGSCSAAARFEMPLSHAISSFHHPILLALPPPGFSTGATRTIGTNACSNRRSPPLFVLGSPTCRVSCPHSRQPRTTCQSRQGCKRWSSGPITRPILACSRGAACYQKCRESARINHLSWQPSQGIPWMPSIIFRASRSCMFSERDRRYHADAQPLSPCRFSPQATGILGLPMVDSVISHHANTGQVPPSHKSLSPAIPAPAPSPNPIPRGYPR